MTPTDIIAWSEAQDAAGKRDAMGKPFTSWLLGRYQPDGRAMRDQLGAQVFESQAEFKARQPATTDQPPKQAIGQNMELFS